MHVLLHHTRFGYRVQAMGSNPDAARLAGIADRPDADHGAGADGRDRRTGRGRCSSASARRSTRSPAATYLLPVVAAVIIGGTPLSGGRGTILGAVIGALIIQVITTRDPVPRGRRQVEHFVTGAVIIIAVAVDQLVRRQRERRQHAARRSGDDRTRWGMAPDRRPRSPDGSRPTIGTSSRRRPVRGPNPQMGRHRNRRRLFVAACSTAGGAAHRAVDRAHHGRVVGRRGARPRRATRPRRPERRAHQARVRHPRQGQPVHPADHRRREVRGRPTWASTSGRRTRGRRPRRAARAVDAGVRDRRRRRASRRRSPASRWPAASTSIVEPACRSCSSTCSSRPSRRPTSASSRSRAAASSAPRWSRSSAATAPPARSSSATASPASRSSRTAPRACRSRSTKAAGLEILGPFDVKVSADENYAAWEALLAANPDAEALIGLCAPDIASLGKLQAANPDNAIRLRRLRPDRREPRRAQGRQRLRQPRPDAVHAGLPAGQDPRRHRPRAGDGRPVRRAASSTRARRSSPPTASRSRSACRRSRSRSSRRSRPTRPRPVPTTSPWWTARSRTGPRTSSPSRTSRSSDGRRSTATRHDRDADRCAGRADRRRPAPRPSAADRPARRRSPSGHRPAKQYGGIVALDGMDLAVAAGHDPRRRRRERRRQVDADEDPRRGRRARTPARSASAAPSSSSPHPRTPRRRGIGIVYQELSLFPERSILANLFPDTEPTGAGLRGHAGDARAGATRAASGSACASTRRPSVGRLGIGERQLVEIAASSSSGRRAHPRRAQLRPQRAPRPQRLFAILRELAAARR